MENSSFVLVFVNAKHVVGLIVFLCSLQKNANLFLVMIIFCRAPSLKSICITSHYDLSSKIFVDIVNRLPLLQELELVLNFDDCKDIYRHIEPSSNCWVKLLLAACEASSHLNKFTVRHTGTKVAAAGHSCWRSLGYIGAFPRMHGLLSLQLSGGNCFSRDMVLRIIGACPNLQHLDISKIFFLSPWDQELRAMCSSVNNLRLPFASFYIDESEEETEADNYSDVSHSSLGEEENYFGNLYEDQG